MENTNHKFNPDKLTIKDLKIVEGEIKAPFEFESEFIESYKTDLSFNASVDVKNKIVKAEIGFAIKTESAQEQEESIAKFQFVYLFSVENLDSIVEEDKEVTSPQERNLMMAIAAISFSTSRGVLLTRLQGTVMKDYMLPIIDPKQLYDDN